MEIFKILLAIHIVCGGTSLILGLIILGLRKGDKRHKLIGKFYYYSMLSAALIAMPMTYLHPNYFLFIIAVFTSYMLLSGKRYLKKKKITDVKPLDWLLTLAMSCFGIAFIALGIFMVFHSEYFGTVLMVFGVISVLFVCQDFINFKGRSGVQNYWLTTHLQRMTGSYIASATAFIVVNNNVLPGIIAWLLPTFLLVPLIIRWSKKRQIKTDENQ